jgi:hypothetical protein
MFQEPFSNAVLNKVMSLLNIGRTVLVFWFTTVFIFAFKSPHIVLEEIQDFYLRKGRNIHTSRIIISILFIDSLFGPGQRGIIYTVGLLLGINRRYSFDTI